MSCIAASVLRGRTNGSTTPLSPDTNTSAPRHCRQKRPGQQPPPRQPPALGTRHQEEHGEALEDQQQEEEEQQEEQQQWSRAGGKQNRDWSERKRVEDQHWTALNKCMRRSYISNAPQMEECYSQKRMQVQSSFQSSLDAAWPSCCGVAGSCQHESLQARDSLPAEYVSMDYRVPVSTPCWWCTDCEQHVMPDFILAGCFPSSPQRPSLLLSLTLMKALTVFQSGRLSMTVFASGIHAAHRPYELFLDPTDQPIKAVKSGPFADCPCCAGTEQTAEDGYHRCACADGVTKLSSYAGVGRATADLQPHLTSHLDHSSERLEGDVQHRFLTNALSLPNLMADAGGPSADSEQPGCSTSLTCCRPELNKSVGPPVSIHGLIGFCCSHGVPLLGMFCNMRTPEQFAYYLLALAILMNFCTEFYIDFGCRLKITWARYVDAMGYPSEWKDARILVNWMHGASHDQRCQIINNGRFQPRAGWRYGEQCEQLWSMMKDLAGVTRYMTLAHRADVLQSRLSQIALAKATGMLELLNKTWKDMEKKKLKVEEELTQLEMVASQAGVSNGRQASDAYKASCLPASQPRATDAWKADYVELELQRRVWLVMTGQMADATSLQLTPTMMGLLHNKGWQLKTWQLKRFFLLLSDHDRISEQKGFLKLELNRLQSWLSHMHEECATRLPHLSNGQRFYVTKHMAWFTKELLRATQLPWAM